MKRNDVIPHLLRLLGKSKRNTYQTKSHLSLLISVILILSRILPALLPPSELLFILTGRSQCLVSVHGEMGRIMQMPGVEYNNNNNNNRTPSVCWAMFLKGGHS
jgi:hypothetical protein